MLALRHESRNDVAKQTVTPRLARHKRIGWMDQKRVRALKKQDRRGPRRDTNMKILSLAARLKLDRADDKGDVDRVGGRAIQDIDWACYLSRLQVHIIKSLDSDKLFWARR